MIKQLNAYLETKKYFVFDFDRTLARMEIDWSGWHEGISAVYSKYDPDHGYALGKNPHSYHNALVEKYGDELLREAREFNRQYEATHLTGFTPNNNLVDFIRLNSSVTHYVYSSNSRQTVLRGLEGLEILDQITAIVSKDDVRFTKPNPEGFSLFKEFQRSKDLFIMIGDSSADRDAAARAGVDFLECVLFEKYPEEE